MLRVLARIKMSRSHSAATVARQYIHYYEVVLNKSDLSYLLYVLLHTINNCYITAAASDTATATANAIIATATATYYSTGYELTTTSATTTTNNRLLRPRTRAYIMTMTNNDDDRRIFSLVPGLLK